MSENRGIFSLEEFYDLQVSGETTNIFEVFRYVNSLEVPATPGGPAYGYFAGGETPGGSSVSIIDRLDYGSDTTATAPKGNLSTPTPWFFATATSNTNYGWFGAGGYGRSHVTRLDFSSDTSNTSPKGNLSDNKFYLAGTGNADFGYFIGGAPSERSTIDRVDYSNDTAAAATKGPLSVAKRITGATGNQSFGYAGGGATGNGGPDTTSVERIDYSNDTPQTSPKGPLSSARQYHTAHGNANFGYFVGDAGNGVPGGASVIDRVDYSSDTAVATRVGNMSNGVGYFAGTGNANFGYSGGGSPKNSRVNRIDYSNDTANTSPVGNLTANKAYLYGAVSGQESGLATAAVPIVPATRTEIYPTGGPAYGYFGGGYNPSAVQSGINRIDYSNDTATASKVSNFAGSPSGWWGNQLQTLFGVANLTHAYWGGGTNGLGSESTSIFRLDLSNDTGNASEVGPLSAVGNNFSAVGNASYGYVNGDSKSRVDRIDYSSDSSTTAVKGNLNQTRVYPGATGNASYGWFGGGGPSRSSVDRVDYSNDTATASARGNLSRSNPTFIAATGNANYGYWGGGGPGNTTYVERVDYSNDTANATPKGPLSVARSDHGATGSNSFGYYAGGTPGTLSSVDRIDFDNDTATASPKGNMDIAKHSLAGASANANGLPSNTKQVDKGADGYQVGGPAFGYSVSGWASPGGAITSIDRIDFNNDTATASPKGNTTQNHRRCGAAGNKTHGYIFGGTPNTSNIDRIDYANDTATGVSVGKLATGRSYNRSIGNDDFGYDTGGQSPSIGSFLSTVERLDYSNDTTNAATKGTLNETTKSHGAAGNLNFGYIGGGLNPSSNGKTTVNRIDYSNDTATASPKGNLASIVEHGAAVGNSSYGYYMGKTSAPGTSTITRIDYSNDTATSVEKGPMSAARNYQGVMGSQSYGYNTGGTPGYFSTVDRIDYSNDTATAAVKGPLNTAKNYHTGVSAQENGGPTNFIPRVRWVDSAAEASAVSEGPAFGYFAGGYSGSRRSTVDRIDYSNDTPTATPKGPITIARNTGSATSNNSHGYFSGGYDGSDDLSRVDRVDYSNDTATATAKGNLVDGRTGAGGVGNVDFGYVAGGRILPASPSGSSQIDRIDYSNDSATALEKGSLLNGKYYYQGGVGNQSFGYFGGGRYPSPGGHSRVERMEYANDTATTVSKGPLSFVKHKTAATGTPAYGYFAGGGPTPYNTTVDRIDYANDTATASPKSTLTQGRDSLAAVSSPSHGYFGGGATSNYISTVDKIDFSNDTATATTVGTLSAGKSSVFATSSRNDALPSTVRAAVAAPVQPPFPFPVQLPAPAPSMGYATGSGTYVQRIDYTNDTATAPARGPLSAIASYHSAVSSKTHAYTFGGPPGPGNSLIQRIDYSNDTATAPTVANLAQPVYRTYSGMGNKTYGYQSGGQRPSNTGTSQIDRIEYANDTATGLQKGNLTASRYLQTAVGNLSYGYVCGGSPPAPNNSRVQRVDYANDTATATVKGPLHQGSRKLSSAGTADYGYVAGGTSPELSSTTRIDYSNDTATSVQKGSMTRTRRNFGGMSSPAYAYYTAGAMPYPQPALTSTDRLDYANDTATASPKGPLSAGMSYFSAASPQDIAGALN